MTVDRQAKMLAHAAFMLDQKHGNGMRVVTNSVRVNRALYAYEYAKRLAADAKANGVSIFEYPSLNELKEIIRQKEERE